MRSFRGGMAKSSRGVNSKEWSGAFITVANLQSSNKAEGWILAPDDAIADFESPTVIRMLVMGAVRNVLDVQETLAFTFGIIVATGDPGTAQTPVFFPGPATDPDADWLYRWVAVFPASQPAGLYIANQAADITIDTHAKRKIPRGSGLLGVFESQVPSQTAQGNLTAGFDVRYLIISG